MGEEGHAIEHAHIARAEEQGDQARRERDGGEPEHAHDGGKGVGGELADRQQQEGGDGQGAQEIDGRQQHLLGQAATQPARQQRADDVEQADDGDGPGADFGREPALHQIGRHVDVDEGQVEAADEKADDQQPVGAVAPGLGEGLHEGQVGLAGADLGAAAQREG